MDFVNIVEACSTKLVYIDGGKRRLEGLLGFRQSRITEGWFVGCLLGFNSVYV